jgi:sugar (pentulose or hexulose) kinase
MRFKVQYRFNATTGEVALELTDVGGTRLPDDEHNRVHDEVAASLARMLEVAPRIVEVLPSPEEARDVIPELIPEPAERQPERTGR